ncbi:UNKNOWN [Stylonychia lemnae]|uniref:Uncharacterized protein n=1 Tax=Stylonychia lemnae TaxID=5949 RepID=A0A077ZZX5_STYLE|nr:UNKNOWN [Stylonychia lemnae]|eukprot:CDW75486.1 UNKNOWN [Stylonychia lemnae]
MCDTWEDATEMSGLLTEVVSCKKATIVAVFFLYLLYIGVTAAIYFFENKKEREVLNRKLKAFKLDLEQRQFFILVIALLVQVITPVAFPVVMMYLYLVTIFVMLFGHLKDDKWIIGFAAIAAQMVFALILIFFVLINPWCRHYYFRYIVAEPPSSFYQSADIVYASTSTATTTTTTTTITTTTTTTTTTLPPPVDDTTEAPI